MSKYESLCSFKQNQRLSVYGAYHQEAEEQYREGYLQALTDVKVILGGNSPVDPSLHTATAELIDKIDLDIMQGLYSQVADIGWYMKQRECKQERNKLK